MNTQEKIGLGVAGAGLGFVLLYKPTEKKKNGGQSFGSSMGEILQDGIIVNGGTLGESKKTTSITTTTETPIISTSSIPSNKSSKNNKSNSTKKATNTYMTNSQGKVIGVEDATLRQSRLATKYESSNSFSSKLMSTKDGIKKTSDVYPSKKHFGLQVPKGNILTRLFN